MLCIRYQRMQLRMRDDGREFRNREPRVERNEHRSDAREREQQHEFLGAIRSEIRNPIALANAPCAAQPRAGANDRVAQLAARQAAALGVQGDAMWTGVHARIERG